MGLTKTWVEVAGILVVALIVSLDATETGPKKEIPDDTLFKDQAAFCDGCYALVIEAEKLMTSWQKEKGSIEDHIDAALLATCTPERLRTYVLSPPKMVRLCSGMRAHYMDQIGLAVLKHYSKAKLPSVDQLFKDVCRKATPACPKGVTPMTLAREEKRKKEAAGKEAKTPTPEAKKESTKKRQDATKEPTSTEQKDEL